MRQNTRTLIEFIDKSTGLSPAGKKSLIGLIEKNEITIQSVSREVKVEAALEKVRRRALAMKSSEDLQSAVHFFFKELKKLDVNPRRCGVNLINRHKRTGDLIFTSSTEEGKDIKITGTLNLGGHPVLDSVFDHWIKQKEYHPVLKGRQLKQYYRVMKFQVPMPDFPRDMIQFGYFFFFREGGVYAWTDTKLAEDELNIFRKFRSVLSLTYRRYLDLKKTEAQAREAQIEAALERVRSKSLAMHHSNELGNVVAELFERMADLGADFDAALIFVFDKPLGEIQLWIRGKEVENLRLPLNAESKKIEMIREFLHAVKSGQDIINEVYSLNKKNQQKGKALKHLNTYL